MALNEKYLGLAGGILWGFCMLITTWISVGTGYASGLLNAMSTIYPGYTVTLWGCVLGMIYGFLDGFIGFYLLAWLYNSFQKIQ